MAGEPNIQPVDRGRRFRFVAVVVGFCLIVSSVFTGTAALGFVSQLYLPIVEVFTSGLMSLAVATTMAYITGSVVDYNGGVAGILSRRTRGPEEPRE